MREPQARILNPGPPTGLTATAANGRVTLSWSPPASNGGAAIIGYDVYMGTSSHGESASPVNGGLIGGTSYTVTGLANGTTYYFTADAVNDANLHSVASAEASATPAAPVTAPGAPRGLDRDRGRRPGEPVVAGAELQRRRDDHRLPRLPGHEQETGGQRHRHRHDREKPQPTGPPTRSR